MHESVMVQSVC